MLTLFFGPLVIINLNLVQSVSQLFALYVISGLGTAGIGMGVMHDANHGSYSKNKRINAVLGTTMNMIGANASVWKIQHNVLHHSYTNINHADDDLNMPFFLRFDPHRELRWMHKYQHLYFWFFYGLSTVSWITAKDFVRITRFHKMGFLKGKNEFRNVLISAIGWKLSYYCYALILPMIVLPFSPWVVVLAFFAMHFITGLALGFVFQMAHIMPSLDFPLPNDEGKVEQNWTVHQLLTTTNYSPNNRLFSWLIGGLNYQVEHHLLPNVCHVHYSKLSPIVQQTAEEYGIPYHSKKSFGAAVKAHYQMLYSLGGANFT